MNARVFLTFDKMEVRAKSPHPAAQLLGLNFIFSSNCRRELPVCVKFKEKMVQNKKTRAKKKMCRLLLKVWSRMERGRSECNGQMDTQTRQVGR